MGDERDRSERQQMALVGTRAGLLREIVGERRVIFIGRDLEPIDFCERAQGRTARDEEIAQQPRIGRDRRRHVDKETVERLRLLGRRQQIEMIAFPDRAGFLAAQHLLVAHDQHWFRPRRHQMAAQVGIVASDAVADELLRKLARQIEFNPAWGRVVMRERDVQPPGGRRNGPALGSKRHQHDHEADVEIEQRIRQPDQQRDRGEENPDRAAQSDPRDEQLFSQREAERRKAREHCGRPRHQHQSERDDEARDDMLRETLRPSQQSEQHEHDDLGEPGRGVEKYDDCVVGAGRAVADNEPRHIDRQKSGSIDRLAQREDDQHTGRNKRRMQALRKA